ncbi:hypothetical protein IDG80_02835 [Pelagibacterales bacterium SAG-MED24]|nr:hypothetical protein [Pelagibacterales bacterium SAG-MED24]
MKKFLISLIVSLLFVSAALARSTGCKEGNCENGYGKWVYTDKTTYEGEWTGTKKNGQGVETWPNGYILLQQLRLKLLPPAFVNIKLALVGALQQLTMY